MRFYLRYKNQEILSEVSFVERKIDYTLKPRYFFSAKTINKTDGFVSPLTCGECKYGTPVEYIAKDSFADLLNGNECVFDKSYVPTKLSFDVAVSLYLELSAKTKAVSATLEEKKSILQRTYYSMLQRCYNPKHISYGRYGARGITVCDEWRNNPSAFIQWALENRFEKGLECDRIDNDAGYSPSNCRWVERRVNDLNRRVITNTGYPGIALRNGKYIVIISFGDKFYKYRDIADTLEEAINLRNKFINKTGLFFITEKSQYFGE